MAGPHMHSQIELNFVLTGQMTYWFDGRELTWEQAVAKLPRRGAMAHSTNDVVTIRCGYDFEPHGRASETWEDAWSIMLHTVPYYWRATDGWRVGMPSVVVRFRGRTESEAKAKAIEYIEAAPWEPKP